MLSFPVLTVHDFYKTTFQVGTLVVQKKKINRSGILPQTSAGNFHELAKACGKTTGETSFQMYGEAKQNI